jgi:hypothetical protein
MIDNNIVIKPINNSKNIIKIPIYNKYNGIDYYNIEFPLILTLFEYDSEIYIFNPYIILSTYNLTMYDDLDFFCKLKNTIRKLYNLEFIDFNTIIKSDNDIFITMYYDYYLKNITFDINSLQNHYMNIIKLFVIYILIKNSNYDTTKHQYYTLLSKMKNYKYNLYKDENKMTLYSYYNYNFKELLNLKDIKIDNYYYIVCNLAQNNDNTIIKVQVKNIVGSFIYISKTSKITFTNYKWYNYNPQYDINRDTVIYQTYINQDFTNEIIKNYLNLNDIDSNKITNYFYNNMLSDLYFESNNIIVKDEYSILKSLSYDNNFFENIVKKYIIMMNKILLKY